MVQPEDLPVALVVDDDKRLRSLLKAYLSENEFTVFAAEDAVAAKKYLEILTFDALILDVMMPGQSGLELAEEIKTSYPTQPILMLTAMGEGQDRIAGLQTGADDYLTKPFEPEELLLRLRNIITRRPDAQSILLYLGDHTFDPARRELRNIDTEAVIKLSGAEKDLLAALAESSPNPLSREQLLEICEIDGTPRAVDVHITRLRRKIEPDPAAPQCLQTMRGKGYVLYPDTTRTVKASR